MADPSGVGMPGLAGALKASATGMVALLKTRVELLVNELEIQKELLLRQLWLVLALVICLSFAVLMLVALAVLLWWEQRLLVLGLFGLLFSALALLLFITLRRDAALGAPLLAQSLAALQDDLRQLKQAAGP